MPRGPFQGTFVGGVRQTVVTAPDAIVYINGTSDAIGCPVCKKAFPFNKYITSISVDLSIDSVPGSASFTMSVPRHAIDDFFFDNSPIISPMMEVEIYAKGYYLVEGLPQYYPIFWGLITEISDSYSSGEQTVSVHCADILKWWEVCKMATNSAFTSAHSGAMGMSLFGNAFNGMNPYDIIWTLAQQSFGDVIVGTGSLVSGYRENGAQKDLFNAAFADLMVYWESRFQRIRSGLLLYGVNGVAVRGDTILEGIQRGKVKIGNAVASKAVSDANGGPDAGQAVFNPTDKKTSAMRSNLNANVPLWSSEYQSKLELGTAAKESIGYELYMDVDGSVVFKPPFYNLDVLSNKPLSWIQDIDVIDWDFSSSEAEVVTQVILQGSLEGNLDVGFGEELTPFTSVTDFHLLRQYGWRSQTYNSEFMGDTKQMFYHGLDVLDRWNSRRNRATITIPMRTELRLGFPVYVAPKDEVWYVTGISHSIAFGGRAQTSLTLTARRKKWIAPRGVGKLSMKFKGGTSGTPPGGSVGYSSVQLARGAAFTLDAKNVATFPPSPTPPDPSKPSPYDPVIMRHPKTGRIVGYPNAVMIFTRSFEGSNDTAGQASGRRPQSSPNPVIKPANKKAFLNALGQTAQATLPQLTAANQDTVVREKYLNNRYHYGLNSAGSYVYAHDVGIDGKTGVIREILVYPNANLTIQGSSQTIAPLKGASALIRPVSDERGFEVVGAYAYGRGVALRDGNLVLTTNGKNTGANINLQTALGGGLYAALTAQSQGLTSLVSVYENPADALTRLTPEDLQTSGFTTPTTDGGDGKATSNPPAASADAAQFTSTGPSGTLGSPQQQGLPTSVEAGQLSKALTLAEMAPLTDGIQKDPNCVCLYGRSDLAFINQGYNIKTLTSPNAATPDNSTAGTPALFASLTGPGSQAPVVDYSTTPQNPQDVANKVDAFLYSLYSTLDTVHQEYENKLRGLPAVLDPTTAAALAQSDATYTANIIGGTQGGDSPLLNPPFDQPSRALGATSAAAFSSGVSSSLSSLTQDWQQFGSNLQSAAKKAQLQGDISADKGQIAILQKQIAQLSQQNVVYPGDKAGTLATLNKQLATVQQDLLNKQGQLAQLT